MILARLNIDMAIPTIFLLQMIRELEERKKESLKAYLNGMYELIALDTGKSVEEVKAMQEDDLLKAYKNIMDRLNENSLSKIIEFFQIK
ncbi:protein of unknown function [Candidatus Nitrosocaldus cavascurensis]|jgi:hypothetical protein|uniref:Uncharacterized protein n=2 Tax=Candidatus Nitrosocaldaceae TaxID=1968910 RepID=A0A2K5AQF2_9ARCH|nr:protein of unknown function [Candidatus Nitrosocaldus cavascurensis]